MKRLFYALAAALTVAMAACQKDETPTPASDDETTPRQALRLREVDPVMDQILDMDVYIYLPDYVWNSSNPTPQNRYLSIYKSYGTSPAYHRAMLSTAIQSNFLSQWKISRHEDHGNGYYYTLRNNMGYLFQNAPMTPLVPDYTGRGQCYIF